MKIIAQNNQLELAFDLRKNIQRDNFEYSYRGHITHNITTRILKLTDINLQKTEDAKSIRKRLYFVMLECLQNITKHQIVYDDNKPDPSGLFILQKRNSLYNIITGNLIDTSEIESLKAKIEQLNSLEKDELKDAFNESIVDGEITDKGGAGLGLITIARRIEGKLYYDFTQINDKQAYFYLRIYIPIKDKVLSESDLHFNFKEIKSIHNILNEQNIIFNFNGSFDEAYIINFLSIIGGQIEAPENMREKIFYLMVQMLQNIVYYADMYMNGGRYSDGWKPGIFFLSESDNKYFLTAGNYLEKNKVPSLQDKINHVNKLSESGLDEYYRNNLDIIKKDKSIKHDLSIIEMRLKSDNKLFYKFYEVEGDFAFFTLQTTVEE